MPTILTLGHSNRTWSGFEALVRGARVSLIADVRSTPSSRYPHFSQPQLSARLAACNIDYTFFGRELGGHSVDGPIDYERQATSHS